MKKDVYNAKIIYIEDKIPDITNLATNTTLNPKINGIKSEKPSITNLGNTTALNAETNVVKAKIPNITNLATYTGFTPVENKTPDHSKYITTPEFKTLIAENFTTRLKQVNLETKRCIADFVKKTDFNDQLKKLNKKIT